MALCASAVLQAGTAGAQETPAPVPSLKEVTITGNPLGATDLIAPAAQYSGTGLLLRSKTTLGETLDGVPGVSSTYFGPNASRPIIRGLDGDRIRILGNGGATLDASSLSYDHSVTADPISIERIEVLRGPGALLYGGSAVGGVVNVIDNRIPREALFDAKGGVGGKVDLGLASGNREKSAGALLEGGNDRYALHVDVFNRETGDVKVPVDLACTKGGVDTVTSRICNSASKVHGGAVGGSVFFDQGYLGASVSTYRSNYGTVAEDDVTIDMKSDRVALEGEVRNLGGAIQSIKGQLSHTDYRHTEFEGANPGTVFKNKGSDFRLEARHARFGNLDGLIGFQAENNRFSADGAEAFAPHSRTGQNALFAYEEYATGWGKLSFGGRLESVKVESFGNPLVARFTPATRDFTPHSYALGALWNAAPGWQFTTNLAYTERAPKDYELFAQGPHVATKAWETGDATLDKEKSTSLDVGASWKSGAHRFAANAYVHRFRNYIGLLATGNTRDQEDGTLNPVDVNPDSKILPEFAYTGVRARFVGLEASGNIRLIEGASSLDLALRGDVVRATNLSNGQPLPRIAPMRLGASLLWASGPWGSSVGFDHSLAQNRVAAGQRATSAYTLWNLATTYRMKAGASSLLWYAKVDNLTNQLAYSAASVLTTTAFPKAPLPGRSLKLGLQVAF
ncbi:TonB-dependent receptor [Polaromonas jejuensis]|uniref:TonB-dependent receptor n=1 Tax=Polaromonas jejuensis TaxID=457502 RepID=A0ABW0QB19_9BURK